jgi:hypothetical protein
MAQGDRFEYKGSLPEYFIEFSTIGALTKG